MLLTFLVLPVALNTLVVVPFKTTKRPETSSESGGSKKNSDIACYQR
jgi:hypothetical protein